MRYLTALARTNLSGDLNYSDRNIVEKLFQTFTMRIDRFHKTWNGSQSSAEHWLTAYTAYYNHHRSHQSLDNQPPVEAPSQEGSIYQCPIRSLSSRAYAVHQRGQFIRHRTPNRYRQCTYSAQTDVIYCVDVVLKGFEADIGSFADLRRDAFGSCRLTSIVSISRSTGSASRLESAVLPTTPDPVASSVV